MNQLHNEPMTLPRSRLVSDDTAHWYHIVSRCVRRAYLCGDGFEHRKKMIRKRLVHLSSIFSIEIASYAVMDNHLHLVLMLDPNGSDDWSDEEVVKRWLQAFPQHWDWTDDADCPDIDEAQIQAALQDPERIVTWRARLSNLGWCLKALKEPIARRCNKEDNCTGAFWEGRYKSIPLLDQAALISCMAYVDLNPIRACMADKPETSDYTGIQERIDKRQTYEKQQGLRSRKSVSSNKTIQTKPQPITPKKLNGPEDHLWLTPIQQCITGEFGIRNNYLKPDDYFTIVENTGRIIRGDKRGAISKRLAPILKRLDIDVKRWIKCMKSHQQMLGSGIGHSTSRFHEATKRGLQWIRNRCELFADST